MNQPKLGVPYFSQWETPEMTLPVLAEGAAALHRDVRWKNSGAVTIEEYARWAVNVCGMACLKMILAARGEAHPIRRSQEPAQPMAVTSSMRPTPLSRG